MTESISLKNILELNDDKSSDTDSISTSDEYDFGKKENDIENILNTIMINALKKRKHARQSIQYIYIKKNKN